MAEALLVSGDLGDERDWSAWQREVEGPLEGSELHTIDVGRRTFPTYRRVGGFALRRPEISSIAVRRPLGPTAQALIMQAIQFERPE